MLEKVYFFQHERLFPAMNRTMAPLAKHCACGLNLGIRSKRITTVPRKELGKGLLAAMLKDLEIDKEDF